MIRSGSIAEPTQQVHADTGPFRGVGTYLITSAPAEGYAVAPQAYLVAQEPGWELQTHFHMTAQFQVAVAGSGTLGSHGLEPVTVHYAAPQSGYGPLRAGPQGLSYLTIRLQTDKGLWCLPQDKASMHHPMKRFHGYSEHVPLLDAEALRALTAPRRRVVLARLPDGAEATVVDLPPHAVHTLDRPAGSGHQFYVVLSGSIRFDGKSMVRPSVGFASEDEPEVVLAAEANGAQVLVLVFRTPALVDVRPAVAEAVSYSPKETA